MTPPSMESIFLILSGVILAAGVLYWFWSHIQLTQKKVQLLENAVFELRGMLTGRPASPVLTETPVYKDMADDEEEDWAVTPSPPGAGASSSNASTPLEELNTDLQPGGGAGVGVTVTPVEETDSKTNAEFRELFIQHDRLETPPKPVAETATESLESMPVRELRRLAEQRGLTGVSELKKKELLSALRQQIPVAAAPAKEVVVERTLDLTEVVDEGTVLE